MKRRSKAGGHTVKARRRKSATSKRLNATTSLPSSPNVSEDVKATRFERERDEALKQLSAASEVLGVIANSSGNLTLVFETILENATRICEATFGNLWLREDDNFRIAATHGTSTEYRKYALKADDITKIPPSGGRLMRMDRGSVVGRAAIERRPVHIPDVLADPEYTEHEGRKIGGWRAALGVPLLQERNVIGVFFLSKANPQAFTDKQIALVQSFAAQAVVAIENTRLLNDLNKLNQQLEQRVADHVSEIHRMGRLRRFLPPQVADLIVASGTEKQLESHRQEITALFCDLRGFTGFSESSDPEDVMALLREYHAAIGGIINSYGGTLERYAGDGVMVVFNDPIPIDNPAIQAVRMAIDMRAAIGELTEKWRKLGHDIGFGIGIAHGFATLGTIGFEGRFDYAAIGTVSNVASRLCDEAKPGQILISPRVLMAVEGAISVEPVGEFKLKGISRPLATYNVLSAISAKI